MLWPIAKDVLMILTVLNALLLSISLKIIVVVLPVAQSRIITIIIAFFYFIIITIKLLFRSMIAIIMIMKDSSKMVFV